MEKGESGVFKCFYTAHSVPQGLERALAAKNKALRKAPRACSELQVL